MPTNADGGEAQIGEHGGDAQCGGSTWTNAVQADGVEVWENGQGRTMDSGEFRTQVRAGTIPRQTLARRCGATLFSEAHQVAADLAADEQYRAAVRRVARQASAPPPPRGCGTAAERLTRRGSGGNVVAALASFAIPGLGQLAQGRLGAAAGLFLAGLALWIVALGWLVHLAAAVDAARWEPFSDFRS